MDKYFSGSKECEVCGEEGVHICSIEKEDSVGGIGEENLIASGESEKNITFEYLAANHSREALTLTSINERFNTEDKKVQNLRLSYLFLFEDLIELRNKAGRSDAGRNFNIAITELENSLFRAIKGYYLNK